jgi:hypothetical protein
MKPSQFSVRATGIVTVVGAVASTKTPVIEAPPDPYWIPVTLVNAYVVVTACAAKELANNSAAKGATRFNLIMRITCKA